MNRRVSGIELVVSHFSEDLGFIADLPCSMFDVIFVYTKAESIKTLVLPLGIPNIFIIQLPNVGRCDHTYLYHIINRYNSLGKVTIFIPGSCTHPDKIGQMRFTIQAAIKEMNSVFFAVCPPLPSGGNFKDLLYDFVLDEYACTNKENAANHPDKNLKPCSIRPFGEWYTHTLGDTPLPYLVLRGIFAVSREHIHNRSIDFYRMLISFVSDHSNPEAGHYMERAWAAVFRPYPSSCVKMTKKFAIRSNGSNTGSNTLSVNWIHSIVDW